MTVSAKLLKTFNDDIQNVPIKEERWPELAVELNQLRAAIETGLREHDFDRDPSEFVSLLRAGRS